VASDNQKSLHKALSTSANDASFIHLRVHSAYSLLEGALPVSKIVDFAVSNSSPAIAITDTSNLFGALEFAQKASKVGVQPLIGCQLGIDFGDKSPQTNGKKELVSYAPILLIAASSEGYANLTRLVSHAFMKTPACDPVHIKSEWLGKHAEGIIALTGGSNGPVDELITSNPEGALSRLENLHQHFGDRLYIEIQRLQGYDKSHEAHILALAYAQNLPLVATNEAFFLKREDYESHDALLAIAAGALISQDDRRRVTPDNYLRCSADMVNLFADLPEAIHNTMEIARRCSYYPEGRSPILPRFTGSNKDGDEALTEEAAELSRQAFAGLEERIKTIGLVEGFTEQDYRERLDFELSVIDRMKYPGYFLIVADFIKWAKSQGIPVGPGRGSGAGSLVAYALTITDVDPLRFSLLFERFLNPDRVSMPDFDIDFCQERRDEVIRYVQERYGRDQVAQIITFGTLQARAVLRDVGRVLEMPYGQVDRLCKLVPSNPANPVTLAKAIEDEPRLREERDNEPVVERLLSMALKLEGLYRHASTHAAGIVIGDRPLSELVPLYRDGRSDMPVTQFNMKFVEQAGLVKFDFLGLKTLTVLDLAVRLVKRRSIDIDLALLPLDDAKTYETLSRGETVGVFQVESAGMRKALIGMKPDRIEDIIALVALYRPGPMENIPTYNARKNGEEELASIHPRIDHLLKETQGVIVYQEQVMQIAQVLSGYTLGEADLLRRAMGKKIRAEMDQQRERFVTGAVERSVPKPQANFIFDLLAKFADYGFNKSHAAAYAIVSYQTAFMKAHYPVEFLAASMTYDMANTDKLGEFRRDALRLGIEVTTPSVMHSHRIFEVGENRIYYSLAAIKGIGEAAVDHIAQKRAEKPFASLEDFLTRIDPKIIGRRVLESLINAGALDAFGHERARLMAGMDRMIGLSARMSDEANSGQVDIFSLGGAAEPEKLMLPAAAPWLPAERLHREYQAAGFYLSAHPLDEYQALLDKLRVQTFAEFSAAVKRGVTAGRLAGTVTSKQERRTKTGNKMGIISLSDSTGQYEGVLFAEGLNEYRDMLEAGRSVVITVAAEDRPEGVSLRIQTVSLLEQEAASIQKTLRIFLRDARPLASLEPVLTQRGDGHVSLILIQDDGKREVEIELKDRYRITLKTAGAIKAIPGVVDVELL
jgi:DNA polymerase III subunit alpha